MCDCAEGAASLARQLASADLEMVRTRASQEDRFHERQHAELASEAIMCLGRALALISPQGRVVERSISTLEKEAARLSELLADFVRKRVEEIRTRAEDLRSQAFASNFVDSGLRLGRARLELGDAADALRRASLPWTASKLKTDSTKVPEVRAILERHMA